MLHNYINFGWILVNVNAYQCNGNRTKRMEYSIKTYLIKIPASYIYVYSPPPHFLYQNIRLSL